MEKNNNASTTANTGDTTTFDFNVSNYLTKLRKILPQATQFTPTATLVIPIKQTRTIFHKTGSNSTAHTRPYNHYSSLKTAKKITMRTTRMNRMEQEE